MRENLLSVRSLNILVHVILGLNVLVLGLARTLRVGNAVQDVVATALLVLGLFAMWANASSFHEQMDEMASYHEGKAASRSFAIVAILVSVGCVCSMLTHVEWDLCGAGLTVMGSAMVVHGVTFAMLEREDVYADYKDA